MNGQAQPFAVAAARCVAAFSLCLLVLPLASVKAGLVLPGTTVPLSGTPNPGGTVVQDITTPFTAPFGLFSGNLRSLVVRAPSGTFDFYYQVTNTTANPAEFLDGITIRDFTGFTTDADWVTNGLTGIAGAGAFQIGSTRAESAARDLNPADDLTFFFPIGSQNNSPAQNPGNFLLVKTDARTFGPASAIVSGAGFTGPIATFGPAVIPEPSSFLFGVALSTVTLAARIRRRVNATHVR